MAGPPPVVIKFVTQGLDDVLKAMKSIPDVVTRSEQKSTAAAQAGKTARQKIVDDEVKMKIAAMRRADRLADSARSAGLAKAEKWARAEANTATKEAEKAAKAKIDAYKKADKIVESSNEAIAKRRAHINERLRKDSENTAKQEAKHLTTQAKLIQQLGIERKKIELEEKRGAVASSPANSFAARRSLLSSAAGKSPEEQKRILDKVKGMRQEAQIDRQKAREQQAVERQVTKAIEDEEKKRTRIADREDRKRAQAKKLAEAKQDRERVSLARTVYGGVSKGVSGALGIAGRAAQGIMNVGGGFSVEDSLQREIQLRGQAAQIAASSDENYSSGDILSSARKTAIESGIDPTDVLKAYDEIKKLSGSKGVSAAMDLTPGLAKLANATGADIGELGGLAGNIRAGDPSLSNKDVLRQANIFAQQGMVGGVEIADFARYGSRIMAGAGLFGGSKSDNEVVLGGMAQISRQRGGAASAAEATLAAQRFGSDITKHAGDLEAAGIKVQDGKGTLRSAEDISIDMLSKTGGNVTKLAGLGLGERGVKPLLGVAEIYRNAGGGAAGEKAVREEYKKYKATMSEAEVEARNKKRLNEVDKQLAISMLKLRTEVGTKLVPEFIKLIPQLTKLVPTVGKLLDVLVKIADVAANNPIAASLALLGGMIVKEVMGQIISAKIGDVIARMLAGGGKTPTLPTPAGAGSLALPLLGTAAAVAGVSTKAAKGYFDGTLRGELLADQLKQGTVSPAQVQAELAAAKQYTAKNGSVLDRTGNLIASPFSEGASNKYDQFQSAQGLQDSKPLQKALADVATALAANTAATQAASGAPAGKGAANAGNPALSQSIPKRQTH